MNDLRKLIGYLKSEVAEETERVKEKNDAYISTHARGWKSSDYYRDCGSINGMEQVMFMIESWCEQNGIDFEDIAEAEETEYWED